jgi:hypothetical protein
MNLYDSDPRGMIAIAAILGIIAIALGGFVFMVGWWFGWWL